MKTFTIAQTTRIGAHTLLLTLKPKHKRDMLSFYPGQYAAIGFKRSGRPSPMRCFSIVSSPTSNVLQFALRIHGDFTRAIASLTPGETIFVRGPFGEFVLDERYDKNVVLMAGGIGITPYISMIRAATEARLQTPIRLIYSVKSQHDIPFRDELLRLERQNPYFKMGLFISDGTIDKLAGGSVFPARVDESRIHQITGGNYNNFTYFICGPTPFMRGMKDILDTHGTDPARVITEEFTPSILISTAIDAPAHGISRWTYGLTAASIVLATFFFMGIDLVRAVPKTVSAQAAQTTSTAAQSSSSSTTAPKSSSDDNTTSNTPSSTTAPANTSTSTTTTTPTYSQPVTSVS